MPLLAVLLIFFILPGLLAAQEAGGQANAETAGESAAQPPVANLGSQAAMAAVVAGQPGTTGDEVAAQTLSRELKTDRLWLLPRHAEFAGLLERAARQALQHPDCNQVLYGSLNEFRTGRTGTSFTILCMQDARTTFNQVFFADDLLSDEEQADTDAPEDLTDELDRLRRMMQPAVPPGTATENTAGSEAEDLPAPVVF